MHCGAGTDRPGLENLQITIHIILIANPSHAPPVQKLRTKYKYAGFLEWGSLCAQLSQVFPRYPSTTMKDVTQGRFKNIRVYCEVSSFNILFYIT